MIPRILLVEDDPADVRLIQECLVDEGIYVEISHARTAEDALALLERTPTGLLPDLVLLDLDLPRMSGRELLALLKGSDRMRAMPIVVLSGSERESDVAWCYAHGANAMVPKATGFEDFGRTVHVLMDFWFRVSRLPSRATLAYSTAVSA
jgi:CheY-like chemotaxis protein